MIFYVHSVGHPAVLFNYLSDLGFDFYSCWNYFSHGLSDQQTIIIFSKLLLLCWNAKVRSQETPGVTGKFSLGIQDEAGQRLMEFCQENAPVVANTIFQKHKRRLYTWTSPDGQNQNQLDYTLCSWTWSSIQSAKIRLGTDCGSDHELLIAKFRLKMKKVGKTTKPFRYDLNQTPYDYIVEMTNRLKRLNLIECLKSCGLRFITLYRRWSSKPSPRERNSTRQMVIWGGLTNSWEKKRRKRQRIKGKI